MKVKWLGHASFLITSDSGTKIITDPYTAGGGLRYGEIKESADIVTVSHEHFDHNNVAAVGGNPKVVKGNAEAKGIKFKGVATYHDASGGKERGNNTIICFEIDGVKICHLGDLGHPLGDKEIAGIGKVDVLLAPVGGFFTIDAKVASDVCNKINPKVIIPMHFKNDRLDFPISGVDDFLQGKKGVTRSSSSEAEFKVGKLPATCQIVVLKPAL
jgi:L-ascorbate metabolism protein UlaG (beta-lactamase superfamily)